MTESHESTVDVMYGLEWPTDALAPPHNIVKLEDERDNVVTINHSAPPPAAGLDEGGEEAEVFDTGQNPQADLAVAFKNFQELERIRYGINSRGVVSRRHEVVYEPAEDYYLSEDESMEESPTEYSSNPSIAGNLQLGK